MDIFEEALQYHKHLGGKLNIHPKTKIQSTHDLSLVYTPGVARVCEEIAKDPELAYEMTIKKNSVAIVTDGSAVLGLGNIGPLAALPVMEGKALLFKEYAGIDAFPICVQTQDAQEIIKLVRNISPVFGGINLEDISAPRCFEIESALQDLGIPVFHDDQHGTSITLLAGLVNAAKLAEKPFEELTVVINGAGAAGTAIADLLLGKGYDYKPYGYKPVKEVVICDSKGIISLKREDVKNFPAKLRLAQETNRRQITGSIGDALVGADVFVGVSVANCVTQEMVREMADKPIIFSMANPIPEIMPDEAKAAGAFVVGTGRSDFPNQVNNVLIFPGIFRGAIDARSPVISAEMKLAAGFALANSVEEITVERVIPAVLNKSVPFLIAKKVAQIAQQSLVTAGR
ncbi:MAG: malate dehydrogenase (oxaloacetate-decarboxylating) [Candidatus Marinamargulisbacteria bacterium]|jgi:malate dehydrogenase (oxaloacetate-decarboxylating)